MKARLQEELGAYLQEVARRPVLTREQEVALFQRLEKGDAKARQEIVEANLRFVIKIALQYVSRGVPLADLIQEGNIGLLEVVDKFDYRRGFRFSTYAAFWIRQAIEIAIRKQCNMIRLPIRKSRLLGHVSEIVREFTQAHGRAPTVKELSTMLGVDEKKLDEVLRVRDNVLSLDAFEVAQEESCPLGNRLRDESVVDPAEACMEREKEVLVRAAIAALPPREAQVLCMRFGIDGHPAQSLRAASRHLGLSQEGVRRIEQKAINHLRRSPAAVTLQSIL